MGDIGSAIKYLYDKFILRDVLSFITPGAIVTMTALLLFLPSNELIRLSHSIHWLLYIPLFGVFFVVGFAVQCSGEMLGFLHFYRDVRSSCDDRRKIFSCDWHNPYPYDNSLSMRKKFEDLQVFWRATELDEEAGQGRERLVVLKQMCANNFCAFIIGGIFLSVNAFCPWRYANISVVSLMIVLFLFSLFWGYRVHVLRQDAREQVIINEYRNRRRQ